MRSGRSQCICKFRVMAYSTSLQTLDKTDQAGQGENSPWLCPLPYWGVNVRETDYLLWYLNYSLQSFPHLHSIVTPHYDALTQKVSQWYCGNVNAIKAVVSEDQLRSLIVDLCNVVGSFSLKPVYSSLVLLVVRARLSSKHRPANLRTSSMWLPIASNQFFPVALMFVSTNLPKLKKMFLQVRFLYSPCLWFHAFLTREVVLVVLVSLSVMSISKSTVLAGSTALPLMMSGECRMLSAKSTVCYFVLFICSSWLLLSHQLMCCM